MPPFFSAVKTTDMLIPSEFSLPPLNLSSRNITQQSEALNTLISKSDVKALRRLLQHYNYDRFLPYFSDHGATPLHIACKVGNLESVELLLSHQSIDVNKLEDRSVGGFAALHYACREGHHSIISLLIDNGADVNLKTGDVFGDSPLHICCKNGRLMAAKILIDKGAETGIRDHLGNNASFWAYSRNYPDLIKQLNLPLPRSATAEEVLEMQRAKYSNFSLPPTKRKRKKLGKKSKSKK